MAEVLDLPALAQDVRIRPLRPDDVGAAGLALQPDGPVFVRGDVGPMAPYLPSGAFLWVRDPAALGADSALGRCRQRSDYLSR